MIRISRTHNHSHNKSHYAVKSLSLRRTTWRSAFLRTLCVRSLAAALALTFAGTAFAESNPAEPQSKACDAAATPEARHDCYQANRVIKTYYLTHVLQQSDANEILIALRNVLNQEAKLYLVPSQNAIVLADTPDQQELAQRIISDLDRAHKTYRLTFTLAESDAGKRTGIQHFAIVVASGQHTVLKQGNKVPVMTGPPGGSGPVQFQYLDIGMNFELTLDDSPGGLRLRSKVEQSAVGSPSEYGNGSGPLAQEPIIQQTSLEGSSILTPGKPLTLGSIDVAGSTRHIDIEVIAEPIS